MTDQSEKYSILLVDDEILAIRGVRSSIAWEDINIDRIYTAHNVKMARDVFQRNTVDVMLCDIEMPGGSGIELLDWVHDNYPDTVTVFLTCHADFRYAREAVTLNAFDYLLKPTPFDELQKVLAAAVEKRRENLEMRRGIELKDILERGRAAVEGEEWGEAPSGASSDGYDDGRARAHNRDIVDEICRYINDNLSSELTREQISTRFFLNPDYIARRFKREKAVSITDYICRQRIELAKKLLESTDDSISVVCEKAGYSYNSYFSKVFKRETGTTPLDYRRRYR